MSNPPLPKATLSPAAQAFSEAFQIVVDSMYLEEQSDPLKSRFVFGYTIQIENNAMVSAQLLKRYWVITHGSGRVEEVDGEGVVGEQPWIGPHQSFEYTSGVVLDTGHGTMHGYYVFQTHDGVTFEVAIPAFLLTIPRTLH